MTTRSNSITRSAILTLAAVASISFASSPAGARELVDPATLNPPPPDFFHASCAQTGRDTICTLAFSDDPVVDEPVGLVCGATEILFSQDRSVVGKRFYDPNGDLVQRHFREYLSGTLSNPSTGKILLWRQHDTVIHDLAVPGDLGTGSIRMTGAAIRVYRPDGGVVLNDAGRVLIDAGTDTIITSSGPHHFDDYFVRGDADALAPVCAALT